LDGAALLSLSVAPDTGDAWLRVLYQVADGRVLASAYELPQ
jgi:hypothetical protein